MSVRGRRGRIVSAAKGATGGEALGALDLPTAALVRVAAAIARGEPAALRDRMRAARGAGVPPLWVDELLLQSMLNVGYPLALAAFAVWREVAGPPADTGEDLRHADLARWEARGPEACGHVYGRTYHKLLVNLRSLHPALAPLVVIDAYGKILGRPGLDARRRELCTIAAIALLHAPRQLQAHFRGALNVGATVEEVDAVLAVVEGDVEARRALEVWELWAEVRSKDAERGTR
jgi:alkylhydroperoxidase/carboxymuconolactone decarboxylase family protein YurZ